MSNELQIKLNDYYMQTDDENPSFIIIFNNKTGVSDRCSIEEFEEMIQEFLFRKFGI